MTAHVQSRSDVAQHAGTVVRAVGRYQIVDLRPHKMLHELPDGRWIQVHEVVDLVLPDGSTIGLQVRPKDEMQRLDGRDVAVVGQLLGPEPPDPAGPPMAAPTPQPVMVDIQTVEPV